MVIKLPPHLEAEQIRSYVKTEQRNKVQWASKWGWILDEYKALNQELASISQKHPAQKQSLEQDKRLKNLRYPETHNQIYGRLASKKEFLLDKYGPDHLKPPPIWPDIKFSN